ncbi:ATP-dependent Clp protease adaptor ClpS [Lentzea alba]|uniref:ATP-dependent Clp protease adaptor ClpS n=1 Tax=Lentzea alba TaxID=2714351 RepID=UPI0039BF44C9
MNPGERWQVVVRNDDLNSFAVVHHLLRKVCRLDSDAARQQTLAIHQSGIAAIGTYDRQTAEAFTVQLVRYGLLASFHPAPVTEPRMEIRPVDGGVRVEMTDEFVDLFLKVLWSMERGYRYLPGSVVFGMRWPLWVATRKTVLRRIFPDAAGSRWRSALFRRRHRKVLVDRKLVDRVADRLAYPGPWVLTPAEADEWIVALGQARAYFLLLRKAKREGAMLFSAVRELVVALDPESAAAWTEKLAAESA